MKTRRDFLIQSTVALAGITMLPNCIRKGGVAPSDRLNVAVIGAGGRGARGVLSLKDNPLVNLVGFADVDDLRASKTFELLPEIPRYKDFRKMLDKMDKQIDAVVVATPDHTHHYITKWCMNMGKHVYVEKPLAHTISEVRDLKDLEKKTGLACQMGNQGHSGSGMILLKEWVKMGLLGDVVEVDAWRTRIFNYIFPGNEYPKGEAVPDTLDWDLWLGPAKYRPYSPLYLPGKWRNVFDYGTGGLGDFFCHSMDAAYDVLDLDCPKKVEIESTGPRKVGFPDSSKVTFTFPSAKTGNDVIVRWYEGSEYLPPRPKELFTNEGMGGLYGGAILYGDKNKVMMDSHAARVHFIGKKANNELMPQIKESIAKLPANVPKTHENVDYNLATDYHYNNWLLACKGEALCNSNFDFSARLVETMLFANIALHLNCNLDIDPVKRTIIGNEAASNLMNPAPREGWKL